MKKNLNNILAIVVTVITLLLFIINIFVIKFLTLNQQLVIILFSFGLIMMLLFKNNKKLFSIGLLLTLSSILMWNFMFNSLLMFNNEDFFDFQSDSEALVCSAVFAKAGNVYDDLKYGLCYYDLGTNQAYPYISQFGLQGKIFSSLFSIVNNILGGVSAGIMIEMFHTITAFTSAIVLSLITIFINKKVNIIMAICFYLTFLFSPWIVNFARNLYWVEFTWFIPMLIGLICSLQINNKKCRIACYLLFFLSILIKSLCGYEYISTIMVSSISFLLVDFIKSLINKKSKESKLYFKTIFLIGIFEIIGFLVALSIHALLRGNGELLVGLSSIYKGDVLRRTLGGNINDFGPEYADSLNASISEVVLTYFEFNTNIVSLAPSYTFKPLCILSLIISIIDIKKEGFDNLLFYIIYLLSTLSWIVLAKSHSYIHTHMNYVLWYFGFIQICIYIIVNKAYKLFKK